MIEIKIEVPDLSAAIEHLADALASQGLNSPAPPAAAPVAQQAPAAPAASVAPTQPPVAPGPVPVAGQTAAPTNPAPALAPAAAPAVPVTAPTYTLDQIARAGASLVDAGKMEQLLGLLARYGVAAVTQLQPDQFGAFATELRALGAQI